MVGDFPFRIDNGTFANLHDTVTGAEAHPRRRLKQFNVCPLEAMIMNVVGDFAEQYSLRFQYTIGFSDERGVEVRQVIAMASG